MTLRTDERIDALEREVATLKAAAGEFVGVLERNLSEGRLKASLSDSGRTAMEAIRADHVGAEEAQANATRREALKAELAGLEEA